MTQERESRPGHESKAAVNLATNTIPARADKITAAALVTGVHVVVVETAGGRYRRRVYFNLPGAQRAADRAVIAGHSAHVILCRLMPVSGGAA